MAKSNMPTSQRVLLGVVTYHVSKRVVVGAGLSTCRAVCLTTLTWANQKQLRIVLSASHHNNTRARYHCAKGELGRSVIALHNLASTSKKNALRDDVYAKGRADTNILDRDARTIASQRSLVQVKRAKFSALNLVLPTNVDREVGWTTVRDSVTTWVGNNAAVGAAIKDEVVRRDGPTR